MQLSQNDQGDIYFLKISVADARGEYPVFVKRGKQKEEYARDFGKFLERRMMEACEQVWEAEGGQHGLSLR